MERIDRVANLMDARLRLPIVRVPIGLDSIVGLIPGVGDTLTLAPALWIVHQGWRMGAPTPVLARMAGNAGIDWVIGSIPLIGDLADIGWKANRRNADLLRRHFAADLARPIGESGPEPAPLRAGHGER